MKNVKKFDIFINEYKYIDDIYLDEDDERKIRDVGCYCCLDEKIIPCPKCIGEGKSCENCNGSGFVRCPHCEKKKK